jgi:HlyD family secretion protein/epimerase transport system membrane fusion protein
LLKKKQRTFASLEGDMTAIRLGLLTIFTFFGGFGAWAALAPLDGAVVGTGALAVHGNTKTVQHKDGGIVAALLVQDGDHVQRDQVLIRLEDTQVLAMLHVHQAELAGDQALIARDMAEISGAAEIKFPPELNEQDQAARSVMAREQVVFKNHRTLLDEQLRVIDERIAQSRQQSVGAAAQHDASMKGLAFGSQQLQALSTLQREGLAGRNAVLELSRAIESLRGETGQLQSDIARHQAETAELEAEKLRLRAAAQSDATHELREAQLRINDVVPRIVADRDLLARLEIRAPVAGEVVDLQAFTKGGVIEPGKPILQIVPRARTIVAVAEIRPEDIENLAVGQSARIIATGFNPRETQPIEGRVDVISADRITDPRSGRAYYTAEVSLLRDHDGGALLKRLGPGMPVEVVVPVKPRTALDYLTEPLRSSLRSAGREM